MSFQDILTFGLHYRSKLLVNHYATNLPYPAKGSGIPVSHLVIINDGDAAG